jgi:hypothetical protein
MTPTYEEVVEKVARASYEVYPIEQLTQSLEERGMDSVTFSELYAHDEEQHEVELERAKAAIRAMQDMMPEVTYWVSGGFKNDVTVSNGNELYQHFKMMGR